MSGGGYTLGGDAMIYYPIVFTRNVVCHNRLVKNSSDMFTWQSKAPQPIVAEILNWHKGVATGGDSKIEI